MLDSRVMKTVFFGTPEFALPTLERLVASRHQVALVVSKPDQPIGRHQVLTAPPAVEVAHRHGLAVSQPKGLKNERFAAELAEVGADVAVVVAYGKLIPSELLGVPRFGFVNVHPCLLPRHRGPSPIEGAIWCAATGRPG